MDQEYFLSGNLHYRPSLPSIENTLEGNKGSIKSSTSLSLPDFLALSKTAVRSPTAMTATGPHADRQLLDEQPAKADVASAGRT